MTETITIESLDEFIARHGGDPMPVYSKENGLRGDRTTWHVLPDGAMYNDDASYPRREPPDDEVERLFRQVQYLENFRERLQQAYVQFQNSLSLQATYYVNGAGPLPTEEDLKDLATLKAKLAEVEASLAVKSEEYRTKRGPTPAERQAAQREQRRTEAAAFLANMYAVTNRDPDEEEEAARDADAAMGKLFVDMGKRLHEATDEMEVRNLFSKQKGK